MVGRTALGVVHPFGDRCLLAAQAWTDACSLIDRPIILVEPRSWLPGDVLESLVGALPAGAEVIILASESTTSP